MTKYDQKRPSPYDERRKSVTAAETAAREAAREKQRQRLREAQAKANRKYHNRPTVRMVDGKEVTFDSAREARRWDDLCLLQRAGEIRDLKRQVKFRLIPVQRGIDGKVIERACDYIADFTYYDRDGRFVVEDAKGDHTKDYVIKRKLMLRVFGIRVVEV